MRAKTNERAFLERSDEFKYCKRCVLNTDVANLNTSSTSGHQVNSNTAAKQESLEQFNVKLMQVISVDK